MSRVVPVHGIGAVVDYPNPDRLGEIELPVADWRWVSTQSEWDGSWASRWSERLAVRTRDFETMGLLKMSTVQKLIVSGGKVIENALLTLSRSSQGSLRSLRR
jgi:hypothetical protein